MFEFAAAVGQFQQALSPVLRADRKAGAGGRGLPQGAARDHRQRGRSSPLRAKATAAAIGRISRMIAVVSDTEPHLLVVDDDFRLRELLRRYLSDSGFRVTLAADAGEARANLASFAFDLIVLDVMMPGESGIELIRALRGTNRVPVMLLTAMAEPEDRINGLEEGAEDYLVKPFEPRELVLRIRKILQRRPAEDETRSDIRFGAFRFDHVRGELFRGGDAVHLTAA